MPHWGDDFASDAHELRLLSADGRVQSLSMRGRSTLQVGSSPDSDLVLKGEGIAPGHCKLSISGGRLRVVDRGSALGTTINSERCVEPTFLREGDRIGIGLHVLEILQARGHLAEEAIEDEVRNAPQRWSSGESTVEANFVALLVQEANAWRARGQPGRLLLHSERLQRALALRPSPAPLDPWLQASLRRRHKKQALGWFSAGLLPGVIAAFVLLLLTGGAEDGDASIPPAEHQLPAADAPTAPSQPPSSKRSCVTYEPPPPDTFGDIASDFGVDPERLARDNNLSIDEPPPDQVEICASTVNLHREKRYFKTAAGESWASRSRSLQLTEERLRRYNPNIERELEEGDPVIAWVDPKIFPKVEEPIPIIPEGAVSGRRPQDGDLVEALRLHPTSFFDVRCDFNAHGSSYTAQKLTDALRMMREVHGYRGALVVGDLSREEGGKYGSHSSHQSGRDVDIWLPVQGGIYRENCTPHCETKWCRPNPEEVDWDATLTLIRSLHETGAVKQIFLDVSPKRRREMRRQGAKAFKLVTQEALHTHHMHVRFRCGPSDLACQE